MKIKWTRSASGLTESAYYWHDEEAQYPTVAIRPRGVSAKTHTYQVENRMDGEATIEQETETMESMMLAAV